MYSRYWTRPSTRRVNSSPGETALSRSRQLGHPCETRLLPAAHVLQPDPRLAGHRRGGQRRDCLPGERGVRGRIGLVLVCRAVGERWAAGAAALLDDVGQLVGDELAAPPGLGLVGRLAEGDRRRPMVMASAPPAVSARGDGRGRDADVVEVGAELRRELLAQTARQLLLVRRHDGEWFGVGVLVEGEGHRGPRQAGGVGRADA